jgi:hypothetical protein
MTSTGLDITAICDRAAEFKTRMEALKRRISPGFEWYPYDSFGNFTVMERLLTGDRRHLMDLIGEDPVLDLGCADGDVAFFLESLGLTVRALDCAATNHNGMRGVRTLKEALQSAVEIHEADLDAQFSLPTMRGRTFGVAFFFGLLYHLKNPIYALEALAGRTRYIFLSTRITRYTPDRSLDLSGAPVAYLLGDGEANNDPSNYWVFTEAGLRRLLTRTDWEICDWLTVGASDSDPSSWQGDARAYCLARSRIINPITRGRLLQGWHELESGTWRWTERRFSVLFDDRPARAARRLVLKFELPDIVLVQLKRLRLAAAANGTSLPPMDYIESGSHVYAAEIPSEVCASGKVQIDFELDKALAPTPADDRELGVVVSGVELR